jgi:hypothetical protein
MKPLHVGLLAFCATVAIGIAVIPTKLPTVEVVKPPVTPVAVIVAPKADALAPPPRPVKRRTVKAKSFAKQTEPIEAHGAKPTAAAPFHPWNGGTLESGGIFSGADPNDPRIYH